MDTKTYCFCYTTAKVFAHVPILSWTFRLHCHGINFLSSISLTQNRRERNIGHRGVWVMVRESVSTMAMCIVSQTCDGSQHGCPSGITQQSRCLAIVLSFFIVSAFLTKSRATIICEFVEAPTNILDIASSRKHL